MPAAKRLHRFAALILLAAIALVGCGKKDEGRMPNDNPNPAPPPGPMGEPGMNPGAPPADLSKEKAEATYTPQAFVAEMVKDSNFPVSKHAGKVVDLTGVVSGYGFGPSAGAFMLETEPNKPHEARPYKAAGARQPWTKALPGQTVTLRARVARSNEVPDSTRWQFIEVKGSPPPTLTAEQLVKERAADAKAFDKKYGSGWVLVTGTVAEAKSGDDGTEFRLAAGGKEQLLCTIPAPGFAVASPTPAQAAALKPGAMVKLLGQPTGDRVAFCILLEPAP